MSNVRAYLVLMRPPNLLTALADILAGFAASAAMHHTLGQQAFEFIQHDLPWPQLILVGAASMCLYAGGVVLNDVFDADIDRVERPERPIPSGQISKQKAAIQGGILLTAAVILAFFCNIYSGVVALVVSALVISYDAVSKKHAFFGPLNMGLCRGGNLLLGISIFPQYLISLAFLSIIPIVYITAITLVSRGEVHGSNRAVLSFAFALYLLTAAMIVSLGILDEFRVWYSVIFLVLLLATILPPLFRASRDNDPAKIGKAVKYGVLGLILLNAAIASGFAGWFFGLLLLILLPFSIFLAKIFAVT